MPVTIEFEKNEKRELRSQVDFREVLDAATQVAVARLRAGAPETAGSVFCDAFRAVFYECSEPCGKKG